MKAPGLNEQQLQKIKTHPDFIAARDRSGCSTPHALRLYGIQERAWSNEEKMFAIVHQMHSRIITSPSFTDDPIIADILFENTMDRDVEKRPTADYLWNVKRVVPFLKVNADYEILGHPSVSLDDIRRFCQLNSKAPGHPEYHWVSGVETTTGPLGQGVATSVGMGIAEKWLARRYNQFGFDIFNYGKRRVLEDQDGRAAEG